MVKSAPSSLGRPLPSSGPASSDLAVLPIPQCFQPEVAGNIQKMEEDYDNQIFNSEMGDLKKWLQQQGIRLD